MSETRLVEEMRPGERVGAQVTAEEIRRVASLANLELTPDELPAIERDLNAILGYIAQLNELDTKGVVAMAQVGVLLSASPDGGSGVSSDSAVPGGKVGEEDSTLDGVGQSLRADQVRASIDRDLVLAAAPETDGAFFKVPRVIER